MFLLTEKIIDNPSLSKEIDNKQNGAYVFFEGRVRNHNDGKAVTHLSYSVYPQLAMRVGEAVIAEAKARFDVQDIHCIHRTGSLNIGDIAIWIAVGAAHRDVAFNACRFVLDTLKQDLPIWKKEHYQNAESAWPNNQI